MAKPRDKKTAALARPRRAAETPFVSLVIPLYNEDKSLVELYDEIVAIMAKAGKSFEAVFVDDGSTDGSFAVLEKLHKRDPRVKAVRFRRNFGKSAALSVGFKEARGEYVVTVDADLQDDPAEIPGLIEEMGDSYDLISGWKKKRHDPISKTVPSRLANFVTARMTGISLHDMNCGLKAYRKEVVKEISVYGELHRYIPVLAHWAGYRVGEKVVHHRPRRYGRTKFGISRFFRGFLDLLTVLFTTRYIRRPLHLFGVWGMISFVIGVFIDGYLSVEWFLGRTSLSNRPLFLLGFLFIIIGIQFVSLGLLGEMINRQQQDETSYSIREILK